MTNSLKLTAELHASMMPTKRVYSCHSLPSLFTKTTICWANNDEQFVIEFDIKTETFTGHYYDWNEETQDWDDAHDVQMTADQIEQNIRKFHLLMVK